MLSSWSFQEDDPNFPVRIPSRTHVLIALKLWILRSYCIHLLCAVLSTCLCLAPVQHGYERHGTSASQAATT
eukprot:1145719-Pelagomonas_calceolata.AAC.2